MINVKCQHCGDCNLRKSPSRSFRYLMAGIGIPFLMLIIGIPFVMLLPIPFILYMLAFIIVIAPIMGVIMSIVYKIKGDKHQDYYCPNCKKVTKVVKELVHD